MVVVNIAFSLILISTLLFYRFIFPKKKINLFFLLTLISILPIISIFRTGTYESGDFNIHIYRTIAFYDSLKEGNIMPSWAKDLNAAYGYPLFIFNYSFPYYILSLIHFIGFGLINSMKIFLTSSFILSGIFMYAWTKILFKNSFAAFFASVFYLFAPYHLIDLHFKIVVGEILSFTILPLIFLFIQKFFIKKTLFFLLCATFIYAILIMAHPVIAFFSGLTMSFYIFFLTHFSFKKSFLYTLSIISPGIIISSYSWMSLIIYEKYLFIQNVPLQTVYFPKLIELLYSPYRLGFLFQGSKGEISFLIGYVQIFILVATVFLLIKNNSQKYITYQKYWLLVSIILLFLISPYSKFLWENFLFIKAAGSHRLLLLLSFSISVLSGYFSLIFIKKKWLLIILIAAAIMSTILNWGHRRLIPQITDVTLAENLWKSTSESEGHFYANTKWVSTKNPWFSIRPKKRAEIVGGTGSIKDVFRNSTLHKYTVVAKNPLKIRENTLYFPGWEAKLNDRSLQISPDDKGLISLHVPKGSYNLTLTYNDLLPYKITKIISFIGFFTILGCIIFSLLLNKLYAKK